MKEEYTKKTTTNCRTSTATTTQTTKTTKKSKRYHNANTILCFKKIFDWRHLKIRHESALLLKSSKLKFSTFKKKPNETKSRETLTTQHIYRCLMNLKKVPNIKIPFSQDYKQTKLMDRPKKPVCLSFSKVLQMSRSYLNI